MPSDETKPSKRSLSQLLTEVDYDTGLEGWPYLVANFRFWAKSPFLTDVELACVSLGFDPGPLKTCDMADLKSEPEMWAELSVRARLIGRAVQTGDLERQIRPADGVRWLEQIGLEVHPQFKARVDKAPQIENATYRSLSVEEVQNIIEIASSLGTAGNNRELGNNQSAITKKFHSLQKIALVSVVKGYGWDPKERRSSVFREIAEDAASLGIQIHQDTVRPHLYEAANDHLPDPDE